MFSIAMIGDEQNTINPYEEEFLFDGHTFGMIYEKRNFCIWNAEFLDWILSMWHMNFKSLISEYWMN